MESINQPVGMDSGVASDDDKKNQRTKEEKQKLNEQQQLFHGCFIDATSLGDDSDQYESNTNWSDERRQGALVFQSSIQQYSTLHMPSVASITSESNDEEAMCSGTTPHNSFVHLDCVEKKKSPVGFYVDLTQLSPDKTVQTNRNEKKNIFSMVIDFDEPKKEMPTRLSNSLYSRNGKREKNGKTSNTLSNSVHEPPKLPSTATTSNPPNNVEPIKSQFVRLSDLEEQLPRIDLSILPRMSRSIPEQSIVESPPIMTESVGYRTSRTPLQLDLGNNLRIPIETSTHRKRCAQRLGTDLLRMFLEEISPDVTIHVGKKKIRAHKCILSSRCQYFAAVFGGWTQSVDNIVTIDGYSYAAVHFAMCHIYSGAAHIPDTISLVELASLADMLCLEGLKEVVIQALKTRHCHNFHPPCSSCTNGVLEVLPLSAAYGLDELYQKCLQWITENFVKVWPSRTFASLPKELRDKCYRQHILHMNTELILPTIKRCDILMGAISTSKWAEPVGQLILKLTDYCQVYLRQHFIAVMNSQAFLSLDSNNEQIKTLEASLLTASSDLSVDQSIRGYMRIKKLQLELHSTQFVLLLNKISANVNQCLTRQMSQVFQCESWKNVDLATKKQIRELGTIRMKSSSSDSSRNSSPNWNSGTRNRSPNLRRNLLLAAKSSQPTPPVKRPPIANPPNMKRISTLTNPTKSSVAKVTAKPPSPKPINKLNTVKNVLKPKPVQHSTQKSKLPTRKPNPPSKVAPPTLQRSGTFLKDEPTVIGKIK